VKEFLRSIRVRLTLLYSGVLFAVAALVIASLYLGLSHSLRDEPLSQAAIRAQVPVNDGSQTEERTFVEVRAFERQVNERTLHNLRRFSLGALAGLFLASLAVGWFVSGRVLAPIARITQVAREIQAAELSRRIALGGPDDELKQLADTFDSMLARLDVAFASQRRFVADASHELRTPLAIIQTNLELALTEAGGTAESRAAAAAVIKRAIHRMARLTDDLLALARLDAPDVRREPVALAAVLADAGEEFAAAAAERGVAIEVADGPGVAVASDRDVLKRAVANLLDNAVRVAPEGSRIRLSHGELDGWAWLAVADEGPGISQEHQQRIFDRFWRVDPARARPTGGSGLGLAIVRQLAEAHGGSVEVFSQPGRGATFVLWLPLSVDAAPAAPSVDPTSLEPALL
jgi:signal transduction histidine kinase